MSTLSITPSKDTGIRENQPNTNYGSQAYGYTWDRLNNANRTIISFDISSLPANIVLSTCMLSLTAYSKIGADNTGKIMQFCKLTTGDSWVQAQATWNIYATGSSWTTPGGDYVTTDPTAAEYTFPSDESSFSIDIVDLVQDAIDNSINLHILMKYKDETYASGYSSWYPNLVECPVVAYRPTLVITYTPYEVYPTDGITRVTQLIHRYNRATGEYNLEMQLGEVDVDIGLPYVELQTTSSSAEKKLEQDTEQIIQKAKDIEVIKEVKKPATSPYDTLEKIEAYLRSIEPAAPTVRTLETLRRRLLEVQRLEEQIARVRIGRGEAMPTTEHTSHVIRESPEAQQRLAEIQEQRKNWWEFWK